MIGQAARIKAMPRKPKQEPDKFDKPKPDDLPEDAIIDPADTSGPHGPGSEPFPEDDKKP